MKQGTPDARSRRSERRLPADLESYSALAEVIFKDTSAVADDKFKTKIVDLLQVSYIMTADMYPCAPTLHVC